MSYCLYSEPPLALGTGLASTTAEGASLSKEKTSRDSEKHSRSMSSENQPNLFVPNV